MILIEFKEGQGLGNQLWNYVTLRSVAKALSKDYKVLGYMNFKGSKFLEINEGKTNTNNEKSFQNIFYEELIYDKELKTIICDYDKSIFKIKDNTLIKGLFQSEKYLLPNRDIINEFIKIKPKDYVPQNWDRICILNIRGGEYKRHRELILPKSYWVNAIKNMKKRNPNLKFRIVTDDKNYAKKLLPNIEIIGGNISSDFYALYKARFLIISNSSFSYFPIMLGEKPDYVIAPLYWSRYGNKYNKWSSPANCYEGWIWQNNEGKILSKNEVINSLINSRNKYKDFKLRHYSKDIYMEKKGSKLVIFIKRILKLILSIFFPLKYG